MPESKWLVRLGAAVLLLAVAGLIYLARGESSDASELVADGPDAGASEGDVDAGSAPAARLLITRPERHDPRPDILLFTIDTLRADHLRLYRYDRDTAPTLDALGARGTVFEHAYSTASWTIPAIASLLTGVLPSEHGVVHGHLLPDGRVEQENISPDLPSLATALHDAGYLTIGVTASGHLDPALGYGRGFDDYECLGFVSADAVRGALSDRLERLRESERPYFLWVHVVDPHMPYTPTEPQFTQWWGTSRPRYPELDAQMAPFGIAHVVGRDSIPPLLARDYLVAAYDSEIRVSDALLGDLLRQMDDGHLAVVVTADHGEEFNDHHLLGHGHSLFEELVHVPLVVSVPDVAPSFASPLASILDVFPTLLELARAPANARLAGRSLFPSMRGESVEARDIVMETAGGPRAIQGILDGRYKYGEMITPNHVEGLVDLTNDPFEQHDILGEHPEIADRLRQRLHDTLAAARARRPTVTTGAREIPAAVREQLEALGYGH